MNMSGMMVTKKILSSQGTLIKVEIVGDNVSFLRSQAIFKIEKVIFQRNTF
jgi:hypothetical protein